MLLRFGNWNMELCIACYAGYILRIGQGSTGDQRLPVRKPRMHNCGTQLPAITRGRKGPEDTLLNFAVLPL